MLHLGACTSDWRTSGSCLQRRYTSTRSTGKPSNWHCNPPRAAASSAGTPPAGPAAWSWWRRAAPCSEQDSEACESTASDGSCTACDSSWLVLAKSSTLWAAWPEQQCGHDETDVLRWTAQRLYSRSCGSERRLAPRRRQREPLPAWRCASNRLPTQWHRARAPVPAELHLDQQPVQHHHLAALAHNGVSHRPRLRRVGQHGVGAHLRGARVRLQEGITQWRVHGGDARAVAEPGALMRGGVAAHLQDTGRGKWQGVCGWQGRGSGHAGAPLQRARGQQRSRFTRRPRPNRDAVHASRHLPCAAPCTCC